MSIYTDNGYESRRSYYEYLSEAYDVPLATVLALASVLGKEEDFDGLVSSLQDLGEEM